MGGSNATGSGNGGRGWSLEEGDQGGESCGRGRVFKKEEGCREGSEPIS